MATKPHIEHNFEVIEGEKTEISRRSLWLSAASFVGGIIQGACALLVASSSAKIFLGLAGMAAAMKSSAFHANIVRLPVMAVSTLFALVTLFVLWNGHRMRNLPSAQWRRRALPVRQKLGIGVSLAASIVTLALVIGELILHPIFGR